MHLKTTLIFDKQPIYIGKRSLGEVLNMLAENGWEVDNVVPVQRHIFYSSFTRHKYHVILKKEYIEGENPFAGLVSSNTDLLYRSTEKVKTTEGITNTQEQKHIVFSGKTIPAYGYQYRQDITKVQIPENINTIGTCAFYKCKNLKTVTLSACTNKIESYAFGACKSLESIYCQSVTPPDIKASTFQGLPVSTIFYVPEKAVDEYRQAPVWEKYAAQIMPFYN